MPDNLSSDQHQFIEKACQIADRFNEYQVDEEALTSQLDWEADNFSRIRNELGDAGYITRRGAPQITEAGVLWIKPAGVELCPEPLEGRDVLQVRE
jgi:hypothetical protein